MKIYSDYNNYNSTFTARCPEIRDLDWAARTAVKYEHISPTNIRRRITDLAINNGLLAEGQTLHYLRNIRPTTPKRQKISGMYNMYKRLIEKITFVRQGWQTEPMPEAKVIKNVINQFKNDKYGNCGEEAFLAGCIAKLNYVKNVYTANLATKDKKLNHVVCVVNRDGSEFDGTVKPFNTIIVDPWYKKTEFATKLLEEYKTSLKNFLLLEDEEEIIFHQKSITPINLSGMDIFILRANYPELTHPYNGREFMQKCTNKKPRY